MCEKGIDACLAALKSLPDQCVTPKMLEDLDNTVFFHDNIDLDNDDPNNVTFFNENLD